MPKLKTSYQVWVLGYNDDDCITDFDEFLGEFPSGSEATEYAENLSLFDLKDKLEKLGAEIPEDVRYLHLQVETVKQHKDWEENVDTIYEDTFDLEEEELTDEYYKKQFGSEIAVRICKANNISLSQIEEYGSEAYWINDGINNLQDLYDINENYVIPTGDEDLIRDYREEILEEED